MIFVHRSGNINWATEFLFLESVFVFMLFKFAFLLLFCKYLYLSKCLIASMGVFGAFMARILHMLLDPEKSVCILIPFHVC